MPSGTVEGLLVGGCARIPALQAAVKRVTGEDPFRGINPDECVAMGAAIEGGILEGSVKSLLLLDVTPLSLGVETVGNNFSVIIPRNTTLPIRKSQIYTTASPLQNKVEIHVLQGERPLANQNRTLGKFMLHGIKRGFTKPEIEVTFSIDSNGIVNVSAMDKATGANQNITITNSSNMSDEDIRRAVEDAERYRQEDLKKRQELDIRNKAEQLIVDAESIKKRLSKEDRERLDPMIHSLKKAIKGGNTSEIQSVSDEFSRVLSSIGFGFDGSRSANDDGTFDSSVD